MCASNTKFKDVDHLRTIEESVKRIMRGDVSAFGMYCSSAYSFLKMDQEDCKYSKMTLQERIGCIFFILSNVNETILSCDPKYRDILLLVCGFGIGKNLMYNSCLSLLLAEQSPIKVKEWSPKWISILWLLILILHGSGFSAIWMYESAFSFLVYSILIGSTITPFKKFTISSFFLISSLHSQMYDITFKISLSLFLIFIFFSRTYSIRSRKKTLTTFHTEDTSHTETVLKLVLDESECTVSDE